jgi:hypothetical protein
MWGTRMAKSAKGFNLGAYLVAASLKGGDLERMSVRARRIYLQRYLHLIETQIRILSERLDKGSGWPGQVHAWDQDALDADRVASLSSLNYLFAVREILRTTIDTL